MEIRNRVDALNEAIRLTTQDRNETYGDFVTSLDLQGKIMELLYQNGLSEYTRAHNTGIYHAVTKLVRIAMGAGKLHVDNYVDAANYITAAMEAEFKLGPLAFIDQVLTAPEPAKQGAYGPHFENAVDKTERIDLAKYMGMKGFRNDRSDDKQQPQTRCANGVGDSGDEPCSYRAVEGMGTGPNKCSQGSAGTLPLA